MNGRDRVLTVLRGGMPDRVPFAPNIGQWFNHGKDTGTLPAELEGCEDELEAMIRLKCDVLTRRLGPFYKVTHSGLEVRRFYEPKGNGGSAGAGGREEIAPPEGLAFTYEEPHPPDVSVVTEITTPVGTLRNRGRFVPESHTAFEFEHHVKDFPRDYPALRYVVEHTTSVFDEQAYLDADARIGPHGVAFVPITYSPIKLLHMWAGQQAATLFLMDYERECQELFEIHTQKVLDMAEQAASSPAPCFILIDNLDTVFFSPPLFRQYDLRFRQRVAEVLHGAGKVVFSHACGRLRALRDLIVESHLDGLEGITHPPLGDLSLPEARKIHPRFIVNGGITVHELEVREDARNWIFAYVRSLFEEMRPLDRFILSSSCNTPIGTPWENLVSFRDACWEFGEMGEGSRR